MTIVLRQVEPFPTAQLVPYDAGYLSGWTVELYQIDLVTAAQQARGAMDAKLRQLCGAAVPGDTYRNLAVQAQYSGQTFKHILVPVWLVSYTYGSKNFQVLANGYTGTLAGEYPKSWLKIFFAALSVIVVVLILISLGEGN